MTLGQHLGEFVAHPLAADLMNLRGFLNGCKSYRLNSVAKARGKTHRSQHAKLVFGKATLGLPDGSDYPCFQIFASADEVEDFVLDRVEEQTIHSEVAALDIFTRILAVADLIRMPAIAVSNIAAKRGYLNYFVFVCVVRRRRYQDDSKLCSDGICFRENSHDLVWRGVGRHIIVSRFAAEDHVAYTSANEIGLIA